MNQIPFLVTKAGPLILDIEVSTEFCVYFSNSHVCDLATQGFQNHGLILLEHLLTFLLAISPLRTNE